MVLVTDILDWTKLLNHVADKTVTMRLHPEFSELAIFNYADIVQIKGLWDHETRTARGLIVNTDTLEVVARPFKKFFNYGQETVDYDLDAEVYHVGNKYDGSLGIVYRRPDGRLAVATRGSFESEQAKHATALLYDTAFYQTAEHAVSAGFTPLCEIVYPENRIVIDYGDDDDLYELGMVNNRTGAYTPPLNWGVYENFSLRDVLARTDRKNAEGWVVWIDPHTAVKIKQQDYIELHRIVTGLNRKSVWRALSQGEDVFKELLVQLPDELYAWAEGVAKELREQYATEMRDIDMWYDRAIDDYYFRVDEGAEHGRKLFAQSVAALVPSSYTGYMFSLLDQKTGQLMGKIWHSIEPMGDER